MQTKILLGMVAGAASIVLVASPSFAATTDPGVLETVNAAGGTSSTDGLRLDVAFGNIQITRDGSAQLYDDEEMPDPTDYGSDVTNYPAVALSYGGTIKVVGSDSSANGVSWDSFTSESVLTDAGRSGTVVNHLTYGSGASLVTADYTVSYKYPNLYLNIKFDLTGLGSDYSGASHRLYWFADSYLGGSDLGFEFGGTTPGGQTVAGVYAADGSLIEAYREVAGQNLHWFAGHYKCPFANLNRGIVLTAAQCGVAPSSSGGFTEDFVDFPDKIATSTVQIDNGFGVNSPVSTASTDSMNFDIIFASCLNQSPMSCADGAVGIAASTNTTPTLASTGASSTAIISAGAVVAALLGAGALALIVVRRRSARG